MDIEINEVQSTVRVEDKQIARQIADAVARAIREVMAHEQRASSERKITGGVSEERDQEY